MVIRGQQRTTHSNSTKVSGRAAELERKGFYILEYSPEGSKPGDVWEIVPEDEWRNDAHYAPFPEELCIVPIKLTCPPQGIVLDPFIGTGTAILAAVRLGRRGVGIDISKEYLETAFSRLAYHQPTLFNESSAIKVSRKYLSNYEFS
jgi:DNA modification methylase